MYYELFVGESNHGLKSDACSRSMDFRFLDFVHTIDKPGVGRDVLILLINDFIRSCPENDSIL